MRRETRWLAWAWWLKWLGESEKTIFLADVVDEGDESDAAEKGFASLTGKTAAGEPIGARGRGGSS